MCTNQLDDKDRNETGVNSHDRIGESEVTMQKYDFSKFTNVKITGRNLTSLGAEKLAVLYAHAKYCQAMTDADIDKMREMVSEDEEFICKMM